MCTLFADSQPRIQPAIGWSLVFGFDAKAQTDAFRPLTGARFELSDLYKQLSVKLVNRVRALLPLALAAFFSVGVIILLRYGQDQLEGIKEYGYIGAFIISILGNATVVLPAPSLAFTTALGATLAPPLLALVTGLGMTLGEMTGYLAGLSGKTVIEKRASYERVRGYTDRYGDLAFFVLAAIPNPVFDLAGIAAGVMHYSVVRFILVVWAGKALKAFVFAAVGYHLLG